MKEYTRAVEWLCSQVPMFQKVGASAYKEGLENTLFLDQHFNHPHTRYKTIHVGGTNGKGSVSHTLASIFQSEGYKVGLYTSPHLIDLSERIRVNGEPIEKKYVIDFVEQIKPFIVSKHFSFFEITTAMAFSYFAFQKVDYAIIEVGLGGRLDCTNIISPILSIITNISLDHTNLLGKTISSIAQEKAGIIKKNIPIIIGETLPETQEIFSLKAKDMNSIIYYADKEKPLISSHRMENGEWNYECLSYPHLKGELQGEYQPKNTNTLLMALGVLKDLGIKISSSSVYEGFARVMERTHLRGRWEILKHSHPKIICDIGHNEAGIRWNCSQLKKETYRELHFVLGMMRDKDIDSILPLFPKEAHYYFCQASIPRALESMELQKKASQIELLGEHFPSVEEAYKKALEGAGEEDLIFIGGSSFVVADLLSYLQKSLPIRIELPSSKSLSNRALIISALSGGSHLLSNLSSCDDTRVMISALQKPMLEGKETSIDIENAGTAMRFLTAFLAQSKGTFFLKGSERMHQRPIAPLVKALQDLGADITYKGNYGCPPLKIVGKELLGGELSISGGVSSQFISALLMIAPKMRRGLTLHIEGEMVSSSYIQMTLGLMNYFGIDYSWEGNTIKIHHQEYKMKSYRVENDWSAASYWYSALSLSALDTLLLEGLGRNSLQGDSTLLELYALLGIETTFDEEQNFVLLRKKSTEVKEL
ncbi:MAG TPA: hypothetical protein DDY68_04705, partial [Porphyromonadaceae bacterium]|nr:hypothetical protein [Porphyromonadaceae bacterium]